MRKEYVSVVCSTNEISCVNAVGGTNLRTRTAAGAKCIVNGRKIVLNSYSSVRASLLAFHTANTTIRAVFAHKSPLVMI